MAYEFKKLSDVNAIETMSDNTNVLVEENGEIVKLPANSMVPDDVALKTDLNKYLKGYGGENYEDGGVGTPQSKDILVVSGTSNMRITQCSAERIETILSRTDWSSVGKTYSLNTEYDPPHLYDYYSEAGPEGEVFVYDIVVGVDKIYSEETNTSSVILSASTFNSMVYFINEAGEIASAFCTGEG